MISLAKLLIIAGIVLIVAGMVVFVLHKFNISLGRLPGDIAVKNERFSFYFPITTCIIISVILSIVFYLFRR